MAEPGSSSTRPRTRINKEGSLFLTQYARTVNAHPGREEKEDLLAAVRSIPGNGTFTLGKLSGWFTRYRNASQDALRPVLVDEETILFPKLTPTHLQQLRVLYKKLNEPTEGVITFWAKRINADRNEVVAWIEYQQEKAKEPESPDVSPTVSEFPRPHLPTPAKSLSPQTRMPSLPPIAIKVEDKQCLSPVSSFEVPKQPTEYRSVLEGLPSLSRLVHQQKKPHPHPHRNSPATFEQSLRESLRSNTTFSEPPPRTVDEFAAKFEPIEHMIDTFMQKCSSGQLTQLGWDSSLTEAIS